MTLNKNIIIHHRQFAEVGKKVDKNIGVRMEFRVDLAFSAISS